MAQERLPEEKKGKVSKPKLSAPAEKQHAGGAEADLSGLAHLQQQVGNQAVQRLLAQRSSSGPTELDDETANRINQERGGGQPLDSAVQTHMGETLGYDFSQVKVHTSPEAHALNDQLGAKAFATGQDLFFREGAYQPNSSGGQELLAHELTHVVQQGVGQVQSGGRMAVNEPGDAHEQEADVVAKNVSSISATPPVQRQEVEEEELQQQELEEEEEEVQTQEMPEEEEITEE